MEKKTLFFILLIICILGIFFYKFYDKPEAKNSEKKFSGKMAEILKRGEIVIGFDATYAPLEFKDENGNLIGMDVDVAKEIAADIGVKPIFKDMPFSDIFQSIQKGDIDISLSSITITAERTKFLDFSDPYFNAGQVIVTLKDIKTPVNKPEDLKGLRIGAQENTTSDIQAKKYAAKPSDIFNFAEYSSAKQDLLDGKIDPIIVDYPAGFSMVAKDDKLVIRGDIFTQEFYGVAMQKNQPDLVLEINKTIRRLKQEGVLKNLENKWLAQ